MFYSQVVYLSYIWFSEALSEHLSEDRCFWCLRHIETDGRDYHKTCISEPSLVKLVVITPIWRERSIGLYPVCQFILVRFGPIQPVSCLVSGCLNVSSLWQFTDQFVSFPFEGLWTKWNCPQTGHHQVLSLIFFPNILVLLWNSTVARPSPSLPKVPVYHPPSATLD